MHVLQNECVCIRWRARNTVFTWGAALRKSNKKTWGCWGEHIHQVWVVIDTYWDYVPNSYLRFGENQTLFLPLTLQGDPKWCCLVNELHVDVRVLCDWRRCCWCAWEPMGMSHAELIEYIRDKGPYGQTPTAITQEEAPNPNEEDLLRMRSNPLRKRILLRMIRDWLTKRTLLRMRRIPLRKWALLRVRRRILRRSLLKRT